MTISCRRSGVNDFGKCMISTIILPENDTNDDSMAVLVTGDRAARSHCIFRQG